MGAPTLTGKVAREYVKRFPDSKILTLAKKIYKENPKLYTSVEHARKMINHIKGRNGVKARAESSDKSLFVKPTYEYNPFRLPESRFVPKQVFRLPSSVRKVLLLSDLHFPWHDNTAIEAAFHEGLREDVDCVFVNGDMLDFYQVSFHEKDPRKCSIKDELEMGREFFKTLREVFPRALIYFIPGNHEIRLERYLKVKAPELLDVDEFRLDVLLRVREHDVNYLTYGTKCYFGKLLVEHGDKMRGMGGVNPARTLALRIKRHTLCSHFHRTSENISKIYDGDVIVTYSVGCLCTTEPDYMEINEHNLGFAIINMMPGGEFSVSNKKIINGKVY